MSQPMSLASMKELYKHHYWARDRQLSACATLTAEQFLRGLGSSFGSVRDTLVHMIGAEWIWLERWRGGPPRTALDPSGLPSLPAVSEAWQAVEREMWAYLSGLRDETLGQTIHYASLKGDPFAHELWLLMLHLTNHQSYHRGQVATLLRQLGAKPPSVDLMAGYRVGFAEA